VEIARRYGDNKSPAFINGILDHIWKEDERDAP
jgi:transcription termination factor NusB